MPVNAHEFLFETVDQIRSIPHGGLLSIGFILALFYASNGMLSLMSGFEKSYEVTYKARSFFKKRAVALGLTVLVGSLFLVSAVMIIGGSKIISYLFSGTPDQFNQFIFQSLRWISIFFLFYSIIAVLYKFGPAVKRKFNLFSPGANLATLLCILTSVALSYFVDNFGSQSRIYGSLGALIVMLVWMQANSFILLIGYELNASIAVNRDLRKKREEEREPAASNSN